MKQWPMCLGGYNPLFPLISLNTLEFAQAGGLHVWFLDSMFIPVAIDVKGC